VPNLILTAPLHGWSAPLDEVPDAVFAGRLLGDGVAIDPTEGALFAPCDGVVITVAAQRHAVTLRTAGGAEVLLHVGIDTVALNGEGFELHVAQGAKVKSGDRLLTFDLDLLATRATSLLTPIIVTDGAPFSVIRRASGQSVRVGEFLMELAPVGASTAMTAAPSSTSESPESVADVVVLLEHGIHARPAATLASRIKTLAATVTLSAHGKTANARSAIALMSLGVRKGETVTIRAVGPDAVAAVAALEAAIGAAAQELQSAPESGGQFASAKVPPAPEPKSRSQPTKPTGTIHGVTASPGIATGVAFRLTHVEIPVVEAGAGNAHETARLESARAHVRAGLQSAAGARQTAGREIAEAHLTFLDDPELLAATGERIAAGKSAGYAWRTTLRSYADILRTLPDARMTERVDDLRDLEQQVLAALEGRPAVQGYDLPNRAIVLAHELLPSQFVALDTSRLAGICTAGGGPTSHVAVLAAAQDVPMLVAAGPAVLDIQPGTQLMLDADRAELRITPDAAELSVAEELVSQRRARRATDRDAAHRESRTTDGARIEVFANVGSAAEADAAVAQGAEGCGLLRTEFLFLDRASAPDEATQAAQYQRVVAAFAGRPVVIRTLDVGGDKPLAYLPMAREDNPSLGVRGVRVSLQQPQLLRTQLRAILRVQPAGVCRILLPMVTEVADVRAVRAVLDEARAELSYASPVQLGAMIETPASAALADQIAQVADFLSLGTNDLTQYTLAMDRGNPALASRLDALHPAVLRLIAAAAQAGRSKGRDVAVCGGLASDPIATPILIGLGVNELSGVLSIVPRLKALIRTVSREACEALAKRALEAESATDVRRLAAEWVTREVQR
jgi:multiphosphoryl transfer protein